MSSEETKINHSTVSKDAQRNVFKAVIVVFALLQVAALIAFIWINNKLLGDPQGGRLGQWALAASIALAVIWDAVGIFLLRPKVSDTRHKFITKLLLFVSAFGAPATLGIWLIPSTVWFLLGLTMMLEAYRTN